MAVTPAKTLRDLIAAPDILIAPGVYDAFSAYRAEAAGCKAVFISGSALAAAHLGRPDIGLLTASEIADITGRIADRVSIPLLVDADQGFGNAYMAARTMQLLERAGAAAVQIEDQLDTKPTATPQARPLVPTKEMVAKIKAALDVRRNADIILSARTDAMHSESLDAALDRAAAYAEAGADMIFVENVTKLPDIARLVSLFSGKQPLLYNFFRSTDDVRDAKTAETLGYSVALFPQVAVAAAGAALDDGFATLLKAPRIADGAGLPDRIGAATYLASLQPK
jgi:2-methylisocitrate lyase-like PEP mutase family enzyme